MDAAWAATLLADQEEACTDHLLIMFSSLAACGRNHAAPSTDGKGPRAAGRAARPLGGVFQACLGRKDVPRFFLIYFIQFSRQGLRLQNDEIHRGDDEDSCSHVQLGVRVGPARGPSVPLASCPRLSLVWALPEALEAACPRPAGWARSPPGGHMGQPQPSGPPWGPGVGRAGVQPWGGSAGSLLCIQWGGFILEKTAPPSRPFPPSGRLPSPCRLPQ